MDASKLSARVNQIRDLHYGSEEQPSLHKVSEPPCDVCDLLSAIDTGRFRLWDPVDNRPLTVNSKERVYRSALEALRAFFDIPEGAMMPSNTRHIVAQVLDAALADPPKVVDPMTFTQDFVRPTRQFKTAFGTVTVDDEDPDLVNEPDELFAALYQIAGHRLLADAELTEGQHDRLSELILNVLSEPDRFEAAVVRRLYEMALKP